MPLIILQPRKGDVALNMVSPELKAENCSICKTPWVSTEDIWLALQAPEQSTCHVKTAHRRHRTKYAYYF